MPSASSLSCFVQSCRHARQYRAPPALAAHAYTATATAPWRRWEGIHAQLPGWCARLIRV